MSLSSTEICAKALVLLGQRPISDIDDTSNPNAVKCAAAYPSERDALLREYDWSFARKRESLEQITTPDFGYAYAFQLPADCCAVRMVNGDLYDYEVEGDTILTDYETCELVYTAYITETGKFDSLFVECLAYRIARALAYSILGKIDAARVMDQMYQAMKPVARRVDASQSKPDQSDSDSWVSART
jgi:hypothetical protein